MRRITDAERAEIRALAQAGKTAAEIGHAISRTSACVRQTAKALGIELTNRRGDVFSDYQLCHLMRMAEEGCTGNEIAAALQRSPLAIRANACNLGVRLRREQGQHELRFALTKKTHTALKEFARARNTSPSRFVRLLVEVCVRDGLVEPIADRTARCKLFCARTRASGP